MKKIVVINTKTGEVQSVDKYIKSSSDIWVAGWIGSDAEDMIDPEHTRRALQSIYQRLDTHDGNIRNLDHRLGLQENYTYDHANVDGFIKEVNEDLNKIVQGFDSKVVKIAEFLEDFEQRLQVLETLVKNGGMEGSKLYTLQEFDTIIKELRRQKKQISELLAHKTIEDVKKMKAVGAPKKKLPLKPAKKAAKVKPRK